MKYEDKQHFQQVVDKFVEQHPLTPLVKLFVKAPEQQFNAFVEISWCVEPLLLSWLQENKIPNPHIVLVDVLEKRHQQSKVVPISQGSTFVNFNRGGEHSVHAALCFGYDKPRAIIKKYEARDIWDSYDNTFDESDFNGHYDVTEGELLNLHTHCVVNVSKEMFAKEPNKHLLYFANLWFETKPMDQCHFRRRVILLCSLKIWPILIWSVAQFCIRSIIALAHVMIGLHKQINWKAIYQVWEQPLERLTDYSDVETQWRWYPFKRDKYNDICGINPLGVLFLTLLNPILYFMMAPLVACIASTGSDVTFFELYREAVLALLTGMSLLLGIVAGVSCCILLFGAIKDMKIGQVITKFKNYVRSLFAPSKDYDKDKIAQRSLKYVSQVQCPSEIKGQYIPPMPVDTVQRITLQYERIKAKVCKPFPN